MEILKNFSFNIDEFSQFLFFMVSVLIPVYNYSVISLVKELKQQGEEIKVPFEILVLDDCSTQKEISDANQHFCEANGVSYFIPEKKLGNAKARNYLAEKARYSWLLFLDADMFPANKDFFQKYIDSISLREKVISGDVIYKEEKPEEGILRWKYGRTHEQVDFASRQKKPHLMFRLNCFMIDKEIYKKYPLPELKENYGYTDLLFSLSLKEAGITPFHIENPMYHLGLENNKKYLLKTEQAIKNIAVVITEKHVDMNMIKIISAYSFIRKFCGDRIIKFLFKNIRGLIRKNLLSSNPSIFLFQFYKLGYLSELLARK